MLGSWQREEGAHVEDHLVSEPGRHGVSSGVRVERPAGANDAPAAGISVALPASKEASCAAIPDCLTAAAFVLMEDGTTQTIIENPGPVTASLDAFHQPSWGDASLALDKNLIVGIQFEPMTLPGVTYDYDFCVQDLTFLDSGGQRVAP